ncbi:MAG: hypothetical protein H0X66_05880 [Verrucomicrobia bacterium]|nr:hypothetical protein [Verrucomicrobiota bacterium]
MNSKPLLVLSVIANLALLGAVGYFAKNRPAPGVEIAIQETTQPNSPTTVQTPGKRVITVTNNTETQFDWRAVESVDYKEYIANLRSVGCPEETIRDIIVADVNKMFESRRKALGGGKSEFWKTGNMFAAMVDEEAVKKKQELTKEKKALIKELLGIEVDEPVDIAAMSNPLTTMLDFLPEDKQAKISEMMQSFQAKAMKSFGSGGAPDAEDFKAMQKVQKEFDVELAKVLSPQEYEDYQLRLSQTSMMMRMQLGSFDPNEQEFRDIFKIRKSFDDEYGLYGMAALSKEERDQKAAAEKAMKEQVKALLGDARYEDYTRAQDYKYQSIVKLADRNGLGRETANQVYDMDKLSQEEIRKLREDSALDKARRDELIKAIKDETQISIRNVLGEKAYESYTNNPHSRF